jgi:hypothetical protein
VIAVGTEYRQLSACERASLCPATLTNADRAAPGFVVIVYVTVPFPSPEVVAPNVTQESVFVAYQKQPGGALTKMLPPASLGWITEVENMQVVGSLIFVKKASAPEGPSAVCIVPGVTGKSGELVLPVT